MLYLELKPGKKIRDVGVGKKKTLESEYSDTRITEWSEEDRLNFDSTDPETSNNYGPSYLS